MTFPTWIAILLVGCALGCHPLPAGQLSAVGSVAVTPRRGDVYLIRGWRDLWSQGIDSLAGELRGEGLHAEVFRAEQWRDLAAALSHDRIDLQYPLVLIGYSYGADDALRVSQELERSGRRVDLVVTIDPVTPPPVPANVRRCYNLFQTNGVWDAFPWLRGIPLRSQDPGSGTLVNIDIRRQRKDLVEPATAHSNIAANGKVHWEIVKQVLAVCPRR